jgi:CelD/BcsL family acetyltransferase involved in cellulose biosynthesis
MARKDPTTPEYAARLLSGLDDPFFALAQTQNLTAFQSGRFIDGVVRYVAGANSMLLLVGVVDARADPVALFIFVSRRRYGLQVIEALDFGLSDYFVPILFGAMALGPAESDSLWRSVVKALPSAHAVSFKKLPRLIYGESHAMSGAAFLKPMGAHATTLRLEGERRDGDFSLAGMSVARDVRRKERRLNQIAALSFSEARTPGEVDDYLAALVTFRRQRFAELARRDALLEDSIVALYQQLALPDAEPGLGRLFALRTGSEIAAVVYGFCFNGTFTLIAISISTTKELQAGSPGLVALYKTLEWCVGQNYRFFDLSVGSMHYKTRFNAEEVELYEYQQALTPFGMLVVAEAALRRRIRHLVLNAPHLRRRLERIDSLLSRSRAVSP